MSRSGTGLDPGLVLHSAAMPRVAAAVTCLVVAVVAASAAAQVDPDPARRPTFVRVEDERGQPLANATVTFSGGIPHVGVEVGARDLQQVLSDGKGRGQAKLQPGLCYVAWAVGPAGDDGARGVSAVRGWFGAGSLLTLRCGKPELPRRLRIEGAEAWQAKGPLRYTLRTPTPSQEETATPDAQGEIAVPAGPFDLLEIASADGVPLYHAPATSPTVVVPPPQRVRLLVRDEAGAALAGASVRLRVGRVMPWQRDTLGSVVEERWRPLGTTGDNGMCAVEVPYAVDPLQIQKHGDLLFFVGAPGRPSVVGGVFRDNLYVDDRRAPKPVLAELPFTLRPVAPLVGSVGRVPKGTVVHLAAVCKLFTDRFGYSSDARSFVAPVAEDGTFRFEDLPADLHSCRCSVVTPSGAVTELPVFPSMPRRELPGELLGEKPAVLSGGNFAELSLQFFEPTGGPARGLVALLTPALSTDVLVRDSTIRFPLDARGATRLRLAPGSWVVTAMSENGWVARLIEAKVGPASETFSMQAHQFLRLQLRTDDGRPIAGARVVSRGTTTRGTADPLQSMLQRLRNQWLTAWSDLATDDAGKVAIPFVPVEGVMQRLGLQWEGGNTPDVLLAATEDWLQLRPR